MGCFVLQGSNPGLLVKGTIDICKRANVAVVNRDGSISSIRSESAGWRPDENLGRIHIPQRTRQMLASKRLMIQVLYPLVIPKNGRWVVVSSAEAQRRALSKGLHLGVFDTPSHATAYGNRLHQQQAAAGRRLRG